MSYATPLDEILRYVRNTVKIAKAAGGNVASENDLEKRVRKISDFAAETLCDYYAWGEKQGVRYQGGTTETPDGWKAIYKKFCDEKILKSSYLENDAAKYVLYSVCREILAAAGYAFSLHSAPSFPAIALLQSLSDKKLRDKIIKKLLTGESSAVICTPRPSEAGVTGVRVTGKQDGKVTVSGTVNSVIYGDHDLTDEIYYFIAANGLDGKKSFYLLSGAELSEKNLKIYAAEKKIGAKAAPLCVTEFQDAPALFVAEMQEGDIGKDYGFERLFTFAKAAQAVGIAEAGYQKASEYCHEQMNVKPSLDGMNRRKLAEIRVRISMARGFLMSLSAQIGLYEAMSEAQLNKQPDFKAIKGLYEFSAPVLRGWCATEAPELTVKAAEIYGGDAFDNDHPGLSHFRDACVNSAWCGLPDEDACEWLRTQLCKDEMKVFRDLYAQISEFSGVLIEDESEELQNIGDALENAKDDWLQTGEWMYQKFGLLGQPQEAYPGLRSFMKMTGAMLAAYYGACRAYFAVCEAREQSRELTETEQFDLAGALFFCENILPDVKTLATAATRGAQPLKNLKILAA